MTEDESDELPEGWAVAQLGVLGSWFGGGTPTTGVAAYWENGRIPWVSAKDMKADYLESSLIGITERGREAARLTLLPPGAVLMVVRGMILARKFPVAVSAAHLTINQDLRALVPRDEIDPNYLLYTLQLASSEVVQATGEATHGTRRLESDRIKSWPVRIAPLVEQRRIVSAIKGVLAKVSSARERLERVTTTMKRFRQAVLAAACSGRLTAAWREKNAGALNAAALLATLEIAPLSETFPDEDLPESWAWVRFGDVLAEFKNGLSTKPSQSPPGTPILRINAVRPCEVSFADLRYLDCSADQKADYAIRNGDLLFTRYNGSLDLLGVCGLVRGINGEVLVYPDKLMRGRLRSPLILAEYCEKFFSSPAARERMVAKAKSSAGQNGVSGSDVKSQPLALPPTDEQEEIVRRVAALFALADSFEQRAASALKRVESLTQAVLAKAFRGELVPTEAELARREKRTYETADELLAGIRATPAAVAKPKRARKATG